MGTPRGYALIDALLACWVLALVLSPLTVLLAQAEHAAAASRERAQVVFLAAGTADRLRGTSPEQLRQRLVDARAALSAVCGCNSATVRLAGGAKSELVFAWGDTRRRQRIRMPVVLR